MSDQTAIQKVNTYFSNDVVRSRFTEVLTERNAGAYIASVLLVVAGSDQLQKCTPQSIYSAALQAATLRLSVDPNTKQAYLVPYGNKATLIVGYKGLHDMAVRTGKYRYINVGPVYEGEGIEEDRYTGWHKLTGQRLSNDIIGWLGAFEMINGYGHTMYMTVEEIHEHAQKYSKSYHNPKSGWKTDTAKMERKTVLRLLLTNWAELDPTDAALLEVIESNGETTIDAEFEAPEINTTTLEEKQAEQLTEGEIMEQLGF